MISSIINSLKAAIVIAALFCTATVDAQYYYSNDKDNTRPDINGSFNAPRSVISFTAVRNNGFNEIQWSAKTQDNIRSYSVEYSTDGIIYQSAGEAVVSSGNYIVKHQTFEVSPLLYRIRTESTEKKFSYSQTILLDGPDMSPVKLYPTLVTGNVVNVNAGFPVERITVVSGSGQQVFAQDMNGKSAFMAITIPALGKGMYFMQFTGQGWKTSSKFIIP